MGNSKSFPAQQSPYSSSDAKRMKRVGSGVYPHQGDEKHTKHLSSRGPYPHGVPHIESPINFHDIHGINIKITENGKVASRTNSFCYAIAFTSRPINIEERVCFNLKKVESGWSGVMRFGFTSNDPASLQPNDLPRYACPDLTNQPGYWAKAMPEKFARQNNVLSFYVTTSGSVFYAINDKLEGMFFTGVDVSCQLWALVDIYGNTTSLEIINKRPAVEPGLGGIYPHEGAANSPRQQPTLPSDMELQVRSRFSVSQQITQIGFSATMGRLLKCRNRKILTKTDTEVESALAFTNTPMKPGDSVYLYCAETKRGMSVFDEMSFGVGITTCDPSTIHVSELPFDSSLMLDRPEYWIIYKNFESPEEGEYFVFTVEHGGFLTYTREGQEKITLFHMDVSQPLYIVFDLCEDVSSLAIIGMSSEPEAMEFSDALNIHDDDDSMLGLSGFIPDDPAASLNLLSGQSFTNREIFRRTNTRSSPELYRSGSSRPSTSRAASVSNVELEAETRTGPSSLVGLTPQEQTLQAQAPSRSQSSSLGASTDITEENSSSATQRAAPAEASVENMTMSDVAAMSAPLVMSALSWLGSTMVNRLRTSSNEAAGASQTAENGDAGTSSSSSSDSGDETDSQEPAANDDIQEAHRETDSSDDSSVDLSLENDFEINSRLLDMLSSDLTELLGPLEELERRNSGREPAPSHEVTPSAASSQETPLKKEIPREKAVTVTPNKECVVCCDNTVNAVVYTCGHACMCFECGQIILRQRRPACPMCRARVKDIIRIYEA